MAEEKKHTTIDQLNPAQQDVIKALSTGHDINPNTQTGGAAIRYEFLDDQLETLTYSENDLQFYRDITKVPSEGPVAQYIVQTNKGRVGSSRFVSEPDIASRNDQELSKRTVRMKYLSDTREVTIAATNANNVADPTMLETDAAITVIAKSVEWATFYGDASLSDDISDEHQGGLEFDGLARLIDAGNVIDAQGEELSEELLNVAATYVGKGYGTATDAYMPIGVHSAFVNKYVNRQTQLIKDNTSGSMTLGYNVDAFRSARGLIRLHGSTIMENDNILDPRWVPGVGAPLAPTVAAEAVTQANGKFRNVDLGALEYKVITHSRESHSVASDVAVATVANETDGVQLSITLNAMFQQAPQHVSIYRKNPKTNDFHLIKRIGANKRSASGVIEFVDTNANIPGTADVFIGEMAPSVVHLYEFIPMYKLPLAQTRATLPFAVLWSGALALRAPRKWVHLKNVAMISTSNPHNPGNHQF